MRASEAAAYTLSASVEAAAAGESGAWSGVRTPDLRLRMVCYVRLTGLAARAIE